MRVNRREFLNLAAAASVAAAVVPSKAEASETHVAGAIRAIAFDGFVVFDPGSVVKRVETVFPGRGQEFTTEWRLHQFEYSWIRTAANQYADFWQVTGDALDFTARKLKITLTPDSRTQLMNAYKELQPWPDAPEILEKLRARKIRMAFLSNFTAAMLDANLENSKLRGYFEEHLTTDRVRAYKPSPRAYQMGIDAFGLKREEIAFAAFGAWDASGAKWFGYPTVWVNRGQVPAENLGVAADAVVDRLGGLLEFVS